MEEVNKSSVQPTTGDGEIETLQIETNPKLVDILDIFADPAAPQSVSAITKTDEKVKNNEEPIDIIADNPSAGETSPSKQELPPEPIKPNIPAIGSIRELAKKRLKSLKIQKQYQAEVAANPKPVVIKTKDSSKKKSKKTLKPEAVLHPGKSLIECPKPIGTKPVALPSTPAIACIQLYDDDTAEAGECPNTPELPSDNALEQKLEEKLNELKKLDAKSENENLQKSNRKRRASDEKKSSVSTPKRDRKRSSCSPQKKADDPVVVTPNDQSVVTSNEQKTENTDAPKIAEVKPPERKRRRTSTVSSTSRTDKSNRKSKSKKGDKSDKKKRSDKKNSSSSKKKRSSKHKSKDKKRDKKMDLSKRRHHSSDHSSSRSRPKSSGSQHKKDIDKSSNKSKYNSQFRSPFGQFGKGRDRPKLSDPTEVPNEFIRFTKCRPIISFSENPVHFVSAANKDISEANQPVPNNSLKAEIEKTKETVLTKSQKIATEKLQADTNSSVALAVVAIPTTLIKVEPKQEPPIVKDKDPPANDKAEDKPHDPKPDENDKKSSEKIKKSIKDTVKVEIKLGEHEIDYSVAVKSELKPSDIVKKEPIFAEQPKKDDLFVERKAAAVEQPTKKHEDKRPVVTEKAKTSSRDTGRKDDKSKDNSHRGRSKRESEKCILPPKPKDHNHDKARKSVDRLPVVPSKRQHTRFDSKGSKATSTPMEKDRGHSRTKKPDNAKTKDKKFVCSFLSDWDQSKDKLFSSLTATKSHSLVDEDDNDSLNLDDDNDSEISAARESPDTDEYLSNWEDDVNSPCLDVSYDKVSKYREKLLAKEDQVKQLSTPVTSKLPTSVATPSTPPSSSSIGLDLASALNTPKKLQDLFKLVIEDDTDDIKEKVKKLVEAEKRVHDSPKVAKTKMATPKETSVHSIEMIPLPPVCGVEAKMKGEPTKVELIVKKEEKVVEAATVETAAVISVSSVPVAGEHFEEKLADEYESFMKALNDSVEEEVKDPEPFLQPKLKSDELPDQSEIADESTISVDDSSSDNDDDDSDSDDSTTSSSSSSSSSSSTSSSASSVASLSLLQPIKSDHMPKGPKGLEQFIANCKNTSTDVNKQTIAVVKPLQSVLQLPIALKADASNYGDEAFNILGYEESHLSMLQTASAVLLHDSPIPKMSAPSKPVGVKPQKPSDPISQKPGDKLLKPTSEQPLLVQSKTSAFAAIGGSQAVKTLRDEKTSSSSKSRDRSPTGKHDREKSDSRSRSLRRDRSPAKKSDRHSGRRSSRSPRRNSKERYSSRRGGQRSPKRGRRSSRDKSPRGRRVGRSSITPPRNRKRTKSPSFRQFPGDRSPRYWSPSPPPQRGRKRAGSHSPVHNFSRSRSRSRDRFRRSWSRSPPPFRPRSPDGNWNRSPHRWEGDDYYRPPSPKESHQNSEQQKVSSTGPQSSGNMFDSPHIESPVAGYKKSIADSTISDAELEKQRRMASSYVFNPETNSWVLLEASNMMEYSSGNPLSPKRLSLDERISMVLGVDNNYSPTQRPLPTPGTKEAGHFDQHHHHHHHVHHDPYYHHGGAAYEHRPNEYNLNYAYADYQHQQHFAQQQQQWNGMPPIPPPQQQPPLPPPEYGQPPPPSNYQKSYTSSMHFHNHSNLVDVYQQQSSTVAQKPATPTTAPGTSKPFAVQKGNVLEIVLSKLPDNVQDTPSTSTAAQPMQPFVADFDVKREKIKRILSKEEIKLKKERKVETKRKRKVDREKKRLEKRMRKEKIKVEVRRLVSLGITHDDDTEEEQEEEIPKKKIPIPSTLSVEKTILRSSTASQSTTKTKKRVCFADGVAPGDGSSGSDNENGTTSPITAMIAKKQKKILKKKNRKQKADKDKENRAVESSKEKSVEQTVIDPELENAPPPPPPIGSPPLGLMQPRLLVPPPSQYIYFQHVLPFRPAPADHSNHNPNNHLNPPSAAVTPQQQQQETSPTTSASPQVSNHSEQNQMKSNAQPQQPQGSFKPIPSPQQQQPPAPTKPIHLQLQNPPPQIHNNPPPLPIQAPTTLHHPQPPPPINYNINNYQVPPPHSPVVRFIQQQQQHQPPHMGSPGGNMPIPANYHHHHHQQQQQQQQMAAAAAAAHHQQQMQQMAAMAQQPQHMYNKNQPISRFHNPNPPHFQQHPAVGYPVQVAGNPNLVMVSGGPQHNVYGQNLQYENSGVVPPGHYPHQHHPPPPQQLQYYPHHINPGDLVPIQPSSATSL